MFSIIIPLYNKAPHIEKAIKSIVDQTFNTYEIIIVNDGSTDNSLNILNSFCDKLKNVEADTLEKIKIIDQKNQGVSTARNNGVKIAKYNYVAFLDADDWWESTFLADMKGVIEEFPEAGIWSSSYYVVKNNSRRLARIGVDSNFDKGIINYLQVYAKTLEMPVWTGAAIIKKSIFDQETGFKSILALGEDFDLWIRVALKYPIAFINKPLSNYNFDVEKSSKAVVEDIIYPPEKHYIFNLDYLYQEEFKNHDLKKLLDALRLYCLLRYRLQKAYHKAYKKEIDKVNFRNQPLRIRLDYILPVFFLVYWNNFKVLVKKIYQKNEATK